MKKILEKKNGITLIALIITIIVMLILVAVTISMAVNGGLFGYARNATKDTELAKHEEQNLANIESGLSTDDLIAKFTGGESTGETFSAIYQETAEYQENGVTTAWIPKGFAVGTSEGINSVANGLVIRDDQGNEFVWIPVNVTTTSDFDNIRTTKNNSYYTEPDTNFQAEYQAMRESVIAKKGFYIARYEAGYSTGRTINSNSVATKPLSKKGVYPYNFVNWSDAKTASQSMYTDSTKYGVTSTLCYGVQWDAMLNFLGKTNETDSKDWGNYRNAETFNFTGEYYDYNSEEWKNDTTTKPQNTSVLLQTGATNRNRSNNIYDVAGNVYEWTMEVLDSTYYVNRGGCFYNDGDSNPVSIRDYTTTMFSINHEFGFRPALYL